MNESRKNMLYLFFLSFRIGYDSTDFNYIGDFHQAVSFHYLSNRSVRKVEFGRAIEQSLIVLSGVEGHVSLCQI